MGKESDWSSGFFAPYYRVYEYAKNNLKSLGHITLFRLIVIAIIFIAYIFLYMLYYMVQMFVGIAFYLLLIIGIFIFALSPLVGSILLVIFIILILVIIIVVLSLYIGAIAVFGSFSWGSEIFTARKIMDMRMGEDIRIRNILDEVKKEWKYYMSQGLKLFLLWLVISILLSLVMILIALLIIGAIAGILLYIGEPELIGLSIFFIYMFAIIFYFVILIFSLIISPIIQYVSDWTTIHMAEGEGVIRSFGHALSYLFRKRRLAFKYWLGYLVITLASTFLYPITIVVSILLPIASKLFLLINENED